RWTTETVIGRPTSPRSAGLRSCCIWRRLGAGRPRWADLTGVPARWPATFSAALVSSMRLANESGGTVAGRPVHTFEVVRSEQLTSHLIRVVLGGDGYDTFTPNKFTDAYVKLVFVNDGVDVGVLPQPLTLDSFNELPAEQRPTVRTYTVRRVDAERREISIDFVVHGAHGVVGPCAEAATPGQPAYLMGPSGAYAPDPAADWHLLAGDEAAVPAIGAALEALPDNAIGKVFIEVAGPEDEIALRAPAGVEVRWIYRGGRADLAPEDAAGDN